jgi:hypothetical protein
MKSQFPPKLDRWITERKLKIELLLVSLSAVSLLAFYSHLDSGQMVVITMTTLAIFYFISGHLTPDLDGNFGLIIFRIASVSSAAIVIGFLFVILRYEGADQMMAIGGMSLAIMFVGLVAFSVYTSSSEKVRLYLIRTVALVLVYTLLWFGTTI